MLTALRASAAASAAAAMQGAAARWRRPSPYRVGGEPAEVAARGQTRPRPPGRRPTAARRVRARRRPKPRQPTEAPSGPCVWRAGSPMSVASSRPGPAAQAIAAEEAHRAAQRAYDDHETAMAEATAAADAAGGPRGEGPGPSAVPSGSAGARTAEDIENAARDWLHEINRINAQTGDADRDPPTGTRCRAGDGDPPRADGWPRMGRGSRPRPPRRRAWRPARPWPIARNARSPASESATDRSARRPRPPTPPARTSWSPPCEPGVATDRPAAARRSGGDARGRRCAGRRRAG